MAKKVVKPERGVVQIMRVAVWLRNHEACEATMPQVVGWLRRDFGVSRTTAYRWLQAWRIARG